MFKGPVGSNPNPLQEPRLETQDPLENRSDVVILTNNRREETH